MSLWWLPRWKYFHWMSNNSFCKLSYKEYMYVSEMKASLLNCLASIRHSFSCDNKYTFCSQKQTSCCYAVKQTNSCSECKCKEGHYIIWRYETPRCDDCPNYRAGSLSSVEIFTVTNKTRYCGGKQSTRGAITANYAQKGQTFKMIIFISCTNITFSPLQYKYGRWPQLFLRDTICERLIEYWTGGNIVL